MTTEQRLERLERENKWMKRGVTVAGIIFAVALLLSAAYAIAFFMSKEPQHLEVRSLTVRDEDSQQRVVLTTWIDGAPRLVFIDEAGETRASLELLNYGTPALFFRDKEGEMRVSLTLAPPGWPCLTLNDEAGKGRAYVYLPADGTPSLELRDAEGNAIWQAPR